MELSAICLQDAKRHLFLRTAHIVVGRLSITAGFSASGVLPDLHRGFAVEAQADDLPRLYVRRTRGGFPVLFRRVGKDGIGFREFFWGLALTTWRRR